MFAEGEFSRKEIENLAICIEKNLYGDNLHQILKNFALQNANYFADINKIHKNKEVISEYLSQKRSVDKKIAFELVNKWINLTNRLKDDYVAESGSYNIQLKNWKLIISYIKIKLKWLESQINQSEENIKKECVLVERLEEELLNEMSKSIETQIDLGIFCESGLEMADIANGCFLYKLYKNKSKLLSNYFPDVSLDEKGLDKVSVYRIYSLEIINLLEKRVEEMGYIFADEVKMLPKRLDWALEKLAKNPKSIFVTSSIDKKSKFLRDELIEFVEVFSSCVSKKLKI